MRTRFFLLCTLMVTAATFQLSHAQPLRRAWSYHSLSFSPSYPPEDEGSFSGLQWEKTGHRYTRMEHAGGAFDIAEFDPANDFSKKILIRASALKPAGGAAPLKVELYTWYPEHQKLLLFTNSRKVWRAHTRGDFWVYDLNSTKLFQLGRGLAPSSLQFAKISPDGTRAAYVSGHNIYVEDLATGKRRQLTTDGTEKIINGTFDWAYEEELFCRDGFRWSPDSKSIAYWQINATHIRDYLMLNTTDSVYSFVVPVQYPKVGYDPSSARIGVVSLSTGQTRWMHIPGDPVQHYLPRMDWAGNSSELLVQQLNRKQDTSVLYLVDVDKARAREIYAEGDKAWIDLNYFWQYDRPGWDWIDGGKRLLWTTEKDGWRHVYRMDRDGSHETLITREPADVIDIAGIDDKHGFLYYYASPGNATQQYLYRTTLNGKGKAELLSPGPGTHTCDVSPDGLYGVHTFSSHLAPPVSTFMSMDPYQAIKPGRGPAVSGRELAFELRNPTTFFQVTTRDHVTMDGWMIRPARFDSTKKYPVLFYVYGEPAACTVKDEFSPNPWFQQLADMGYVIISLDNRGTPAPKGRAWRKAILKKIGVLNIRDQAMAAEQILKWTWVDNSRIAVWGWSGGGSSTQNLMFQYPDIYQTGIAVAGVSNLLYYDNIYEERYMGLLPEDLKYYQAGSSVNHVKGLRGNLLIIHGSGDDNVHYQNQEALINALVGAGKQFSMMEYPNRTHAISEGEGTTRHLYTLMTDFLEQHCPPGAY